MDLWVTATPFGLPQAAASKDWGWSGVPGYVYPPPPVDPDVKITYASSSQSMDAGSMQSSRVCCSVGSLAELCLRKLLFAGSRLPCRLLSRPGSERRDPSTAGIEDGISCSCCGPGDQKCRLLNSKTCPVQLHWSCQNQNHPCIFHHVLNTLPRQAIIARDIHSPDHQNRQGGHHNLQKVSEIRDACKNMIYIYI